MLISEFIYSWLKDIVVLFIIITLADLIMPKGHLKRYMNFIIGLVLIFMVISPFLRLFSMDFKLDRDSIDKYKTQEVYDIDFTKEQSEKIEEIYIDKIESEISLLVEKESEYRINKTNIAIDKSEKDFGKVTKLEIEIVDSSDSDLNKDVKKINIKKVDKISMKEGEKSLRVDKDNFGLLKDLISREFGINEDIIIIYTNN